MTLFFFVVGWRSSARWSPASCPTRARRCCRSWPPSAAWSSPRRLYFVILWGRPGAHGWGVPMATDIAFVVGFLTLLGPRVPDGLKILLLTLAIADDIGAVLVIAVVYSTGIHVRSLAPCRCRARR